MSVSGISSGSFAAVAAGLRAQMQAQTMQTVLADSGLLSAELGAAYEILQQEGAAITQAGLEAVRMDVIGSTIDLLA